VPEVMGEEAETKSLNRGSTEGDGSRTERVTLLEQHKGEPTSESRIRRVITMGPKKKSGEKKEGGDWERRPIVKGRLS